MAQIVAEFKLAKVLRQVLRGNVHMRPANRPLQHGPEAFKAVRMRRTPHVLFETVIDRCVVVSDVFEITVRPMIVSADFASARDVLANVLLKFAALSVRNNAGHHVAVAFKHSEDNRLVCHRALATTARALPANESFIRLNMSRQPVVAVNACHVLADFMGHAERGRIRHAQLPLQFLCGHAVARRGEQVDRIEPFHERHMRLSKGRSHHRVNVMPAPLAGIGQFTRQPGEAARLVTFGAFQGFAVPEFHKMVQAGAIVWKALIKLLQCEGLSLWGLFHRRLHAYLYRGVEYVCQVYNRVIFASPFFHTTEAMWECNPPSSKGCERFICATNSHNHRGEESGISSRSETH